MKPTASGTLVKPTCQKKSSVELVPVLNLFWRARNTTLPVTFCYTWVRWPAVSKHCTLFTRLVEWSWKEQFTRTIRYCSNFPVNSVKGRSTTSVVNVADHCQITGKSGFAIDVIYDAPCLISFLSTYTMSDSFIFHVLWKLYPSTIEWLTWLWSLSTTSNGQ